jgi:hypothetical protein
MSSAAACGSCVKSEIASGLKFRQIAGQNLSGKNQAGQISAGIPASTEASVAEKALKVSAATGAV